MKHKICEINQKMNGCLFPIILLPIWIFLYHHLQTFADFIINDIFQMSTGKHLTETLRFFIFEVPKVLMLLVLIIWGVGIIRTYFTPERTRKILQGKSLFTGNILSALLGIGYPVLLLLCHPSISRICGSGCPLGSHFLISGRRSND